MNDIDIDDDDDIDPAQAETPDLQKLIQAAVRREVAQRSGRGEPQPGMTVEQQYDLAVDTARNGLYGSRAAGADVMRGAVKAMLVHQLKKEGRLP